MTNRYFQKINFLLFWVVSKFVKLFFFSSLCVQSLWKVKYGYQITQNWRNCLLIAIRLYLNNVVKGTIQPDWISSEWYYWKGLKKDINCYRFLIFDFWFWIFEKTSKFLAASYKNASNPPTYWDHGLYGHIPRSFLTNRAPKMREIQQLFLGLRLVRRIKPIIRNPN